MPVSSKKQRGKQRKAAKNQAASAASTSATIPNGLELEALVTERYAPPNTTPPPPGGVSSTAMKIGNAFIKQYYKILLTSPSQLNRFYQPDSIVSRGMEPSTPATHSSLATTIANGSDDSPGERVRRAFFEWAGAGLTDEHDDECARVDFEHGALDAQESINGGILLVVTGHMFLPGKVKSLQFVHTFFLNNNSAPGMKKQFLVTNDILRFLEPVDAEEEEEEEDIEEEVSFQISMGDHDATTSLCQSEQTVTPIAKSGILSTVLSFIEQCESDMFDNVVLAAACAARARGLGTLGYSGMLKSPVFWIAILRKAVIQDDVCISLDNTRSIGPLVRCMCNDTERLFFKSNKHWREGIMPFVQLMSDMISKSIKSTDKEVVNTLLQQHEGLLPSIVQWAFWNDIHRPDIIKVLGVDDGNSIITLGGDIATELILDEDNFIRDESGELTATKDGKKRLRSIGTSPIVSKDYDPTCTTSFVVGFIRLLKDKGICHREPNSSILEHLIGQSDCVDKDVITEVIDLGTNYVSDFESAEFAAKLSSYILCNEFELAGDIECEPNNTRVTFAIRNGLIDMCLNLIMRFGWHESFCKQTNDECLYRNIWHILNVISDISLHKKTAKALRHKKDEIQNQLDRLEKIATSNTEVERLFDMVECILDNTGAYCCRCNKSLTRTEVMECNGCGQMSYCSRACQKDDWLNGHSATCCKSYTDDTAGQFQGRVLPKTATEDGKDRPVLAYDKDGLFQGSAVQTVAPILENERAVTKLAELEKNITMIQLKLFRDHAEYILSQSSSLDIPLWDCVVVFDLRYCPPEVEVKKYTDHYMPKAAKGFRKTRSKDNITCIYNSYIFNGSYAKDDGDKTQIYNVPKLSMQRVFPHEWL